MEGIGRSTSGQAKLFFSFLPAVSLLFTFFRPPFLCLPPLQLQLSRPLLRGLLLRVCCCESWLHCHFRCCNWRIGQEIPAWHKNEVRLLLWKPAWLPSLSGTRKRSWAGGRSFFHGKVLVYYTETDTNSRCGTQERDGPVS